MGTTDRLGHQGLSTAGRCAGPGIQRLVRKHQILLCGLNLLNFRCEALPDVRRVEMATAPEFTKLGSRRALRVGAASFYQQVRRTGVVRVEQHIYVGNMVNVARQIRLYGPVRGLPDGA